MATTIDPRDTTATRTDSSLPWLRPAQTRTLAAICETLIPALDRDASADPHGFLRRPASELQVAERLAETLAAEDEATRAQFRQLLDLLGGPLGGLLLVGRPRGFARLTPAQRASALRVMADSPIATLRQGFQAIKRLATFIFYSAPAADGGPNPNWIALDFAPPPPPPATPKPIHPLAITGPTTLDCDVVVVGSGAGGGVVAAELAASGASVIVVEKGGYYNEADFDGREAEMMPKLYLKRGLQSTRDLSMAILAGSCLGGGTVVNWSTSFRAPQRVLDEWERDYGLSDIAGPRFQEHYDAVAARVGVNSEDSAPNASNAIIERGSAALGRRWGVIPRNASDCQQRCGACGYGCAFGRKQSTLKTYLQDAADHGARFLVHCGVDRVLIERGAATGVSATAWDPATGARHPVTIHARTVVIAAGALHSPAILLRSGLSNPHLGHHLHLHPVVSVSGFYPEPIYNWQGSLQTRYSNHFDALEGGYGYTFEMAPGHPGLIALSLPWESGEQHKRTMQQSKYVAPLIILVRDKNGGRITLDKHNEPVVDYPLGDFERRMLAHGTAEGIALHLAAGARAVGTLHSRLTMLESAMPDQTPPFTPNQIAAFQKTVAARSLAPNKVMLFSAHQMGTCRLAADPARGVIGDDHQVFGVKGLYVADGSTFPTASGVNPMLTILALAHRASVAIKSAR